MDMPEMEPRALKEQPGLLTAESSIILSPSVLILQMMKPRPGDNSAGLQLQLRNGAGFQHRVAVLLGTYSELFES